VKIEDSPFLPKEQFERVEIPVEAFGLSHMLNGKAPIETLKLSMERMAGYWCAVFRADLPTVTLATQRWPADWREAVKERWAPAWALKRWPVRYNTLSLGEVVDKQIPRGFGPTFTFVKMNDSLLSLTRDRQRTDIPPGDRPPPAGP
jgi:hypothetical protein